MNFFRHGRPKYGLIEHKIKYIIGSYQKINLADTSGKIVFLVFKRISLAIFQENKLFTENLQEGVKNWSLIEEKGLCIQNIELMDRKKTLWVLREFIT